MLNLYEKASNAKLNIEKTVMVKVGLPKFQGLQDVATNGESVIFKYLGFMFGSNGIAVVAMEKALLDSINLVLMFGDLLSLI